MELNKKICLIECLKCYVEHLILFHRFELLVPPQLNPVGEAVDHTSNRNYLNEMKVNFQIIGNRWRKRREEQSDRLSADRSAYLDANERKYPFTYMIDCLTEECRHNSLVAKYLSRPKTTINENQQPLESFYPPNSIIVTIFWAFFNCFGSFLFESMFQDLLEVCLEPNFSTKLKQILILYVLCDLMSTELAPNVQNHVSLSISSQFNKRFDPSLSIFI